MDVRSKGYRALLAQRLLAAQFLNLHPDRERAINALIKWQMIYAGTTGFLTSFGGVITLPVAVPVNLGVVLCIQLRMIQAIAHLRGHDLKSDRVRGLAEACLAGSSAIETVKEAGINITSKLTAQAIKKIPGTAVTKLNHAVGFRLLTKAGTRGIINLPKVIPIVGGLMSGAIDAGTTRAIGGAAKKIFTAIPSDNP